MFAYEICPDLGAALGSAFGYTTILGTVIAAIIIFLF
jgi:hypothetical protein